MENIIKKIIHIFSVLILLSLTQCATRSAPVAGLPDNILGIKIGMPKEDAEKHLREIGKFSRDETKRQQVWALRDDPHFGSVGIGYDRENRVQFITAIAKPKDSKSMRFTEIGDIKAAKEEIVGTNHRYSWDVPSQNDKAGYSVIAQGDNADFLSLYTLVKPEDKDDEAEEEKEDRK